MKKMLIVVLLLLISWPCFAQNVRREGTVRWVTFDEDTRVRYNNKRLIDILTKNIEHISEWNGRQFVGIPIWQDFPAGQAVMVAGKLYRYRVNALSTNVILLPPNTAWRVFNFRTKRIATVISSDATLDFRYKAAHKARILSLHKRKVKEKPGAIGIIPGEPE